MNKELRKTISPQPGPQTTFAQLSPGMSGDENDDGVVLAFYGGAAGGGKAGRFFLKF